jgi:hypothetical protein
VAESLPGKIVEEHPKKLTLLTTPRSVLSEKKQSATTNNGCKTNYYGERIGMIICKHVWHGNYDAMQLIQTRKAMRGGTPRP